MTENFIAELNRRDTERIKSYQTLLNFYQGQHWPDRPRWGEKRLTFNYARLFVDKITSYLMSGVSFAIDAAQDSDQARQQAQRAEAALLEVYQQNSLEQLDLETETDCAVMGDAAYKVIWDSAAKTVRVTAPDIQGIYAWWPGDDAAQVWRVASKYRLSPEESERLYQRKPRGETATVIEVWTDASFELYLDGELLESRPNPYRCIPFVIYPNMREPKKLWGVSDLVPIMEGQQELNRALSQLSRILELSGNPIAVLENVEGSQDIAVRPGAVWNLPEDSRAYLLDLLQGGGLNLHIDYINLLYRSLHDLAESPRAAFGGTERDLSGVALEIELQPLLQKVSRKRIIRSATYNRRNRLILDLLEKYRGEDFGPLRLRTVWCPVMPRDTARLVSSEQTLIQSGIHSRRRAMDELGVADPELEFRRWLEERAQILKMNQEFNARGPKTSRERGTEGRADGSEE
ncbi:MAG: phage portal protein [Chloroflexota bacterium]